MYEPIPVRDLISRLEQLDMASGAERTALADALLQVANDTLTAEGDRGVWQATRPGNGTRKGTAEVLGTSVPYVQKRSSRWSVYRESAAGRKAERKRSK